MRLLALLALSGCLAQPSPPDDPAHEWRELPGANQPGALHSPRMTWDSTRKAVVLFGGVNADGATSKTWQLTDGVWTEICPTTTLPPLYSPAFAFDPIGQQLVIAAGSSTADFKQPTTTVFTCSSTAVDAPWIPHAVPVPNAVVGAQLVYDEGRGVLILVGGTDAAGMYARESSVTSDLVSWAPLGLPSPATFGGPATNITYDAHDQRILALKNYTGPFGSRVEATNELWQLPRNAGNWSLICGPSTKPCGWDSRSDAALVHLGDSLSTIAIGGYNGATGAELAGSWVLDNDQLIHSHEDPPTRDRAAVAYDPDRKQAILYGGNGAGCTGEMQNCETTWVLE